MAPLLPPMSALPMLPRERRGGGASTASPLALLLTSRGPPAERRLPAEKMNQVQCQEGEEGRGEAQAASFCFSCLKLVTSQGLGLGRLYTDPRGLWLPF